MKKFIICLTAIVIILWVVGINQPGCCTSTGVEYGGEEQY